MKKRLFVLLFVLSSIPAYSRAGGEVAACLDDGFPCERPSEVAIEYTEPYVAEIGFCGKDLWLATFKDGAVSLRSHKPDTVDFSSAALTEVSVDFILATFAAREWGQGKVLDLSGEGNAAPTIQGRIAREKMVSRGATVLVNL